MHSYEKQALSGAIEILSQSELPDRFEGMKLYGHNFFWHAPGLQNFPTIK